ADDTRVHAWKRLARGRRDASAGIGGDAGTRAKRIGRSARTFSTARSRQITTRQSDSRLRVKSGVIRLSSSADICAIRRAQPAATFCVYSTAKRFLGEISMLGTARRGGVWMASAAIMA